MLKYVEGDLLVALTEGDVDVLVHGCNCFHAMGGGIARQIKTLWPEVAKADKQNSTYAARGKLGLFTSAIVPRDDGSKGVVINAYTQYKYSSQDAQVDYEAIECAFKTIVDVYHNSDVVIGIPKIGAGLAGGDWDKIEGIINTILDSRPDAKLSIVCYTI